MRAYERFLNYVKIHTRSDEDSTAAPSTHRQFELALLLVQELKSLGVKDAMVDAKCRVYAHLPATQGQEKEPVMGFIAHLDTADFPGEKVRPRLHPDYDGGNVALEGVTLTTERFPHLKDLRGQTLITASGDTLLGADDKAGIAEIMTMAEELLKNQLPHGKIAIAFTPDEEIGRGADHFDLARFGAAFAYTVDGGTEGEIESENFNACQAEVQFHGVDVHPGYAKDVMVNAVQVAVAFGALLPPDQTPRDTEGYEGFFHLMQLEGGVTEAKARYIVRDHDTAGFERRKQMLRRAAETLNNRYGVGTVELSIQEQYRNMKEILDHNPDLVRRAEAAARWAGITPRHKPIRGGTDGAQLSFMGLPCPNLGTGGHCFHGPYEHITVEAMDKVTAMLVALATGKGI